MQIIMEKRKKKKKKTHADVRGEEDKHHGIYEGQFVCLCLFDWFSSRRLIHSYIQ